MFPSSARLLPVGSLLLLVLPGLGGAQNARATHRLLGPRAEVSTPFSRLSMTVDVGVFIPNDQAKAYRSAPGGTATIGYRVSRNVQLEGGWTRVIGAADVSRYISTNRGTRSTSDYEEFLTLGVRAISVDKAESAAVSFGAGFVLAAYSEQGVAGRNETITCYTCMDAVSGAGGYASFDVDAYGGADNDVGLGLLVRVFAVQMEGYFAADPEYDAPPRPVDLAQHRPETDLAHVRGLGGHESSVFSHDRVP